LSRKILQLKNAEDETTNFLCEASDLLGVPRGGGMIKKRDIIINSFVGINFIFFSLLQTLIYI
jgi:hypothetical protein